MNDLKCSDLSKLNCCDKLNSISGVFLSIFLPTRILAYEQEEVAWKNNSIRCKLFNTLKPWKPLT